MATQAIVLQDQTHQRLKSLWETCSKENQLKKLRQKSWDTYQNLGLPSRKAEVFRYVPMRKFYVKEIEQPQLTRPQIDNFTYPECKDNSLVFVNGFFNPHMSNFKHTSVVSLPLTQAMNTYSAFITNQWEEELSKETDPFAALNGALHGEGLFLYVPPNTHIENPLEILHVIDAQKKHAMIQPRIHLFVGRNASIKIIRTQKRVTGESYTVNGAFYVALEENAILNYTHSILEEPQNVWHFESIRASLKRDSKLNTIQITDGAETIRHDYKVYLNGEGSEARLNGLMMLDDARQAHANVLIEHRAPQCTSYQLFKNALNDTSRSSFEGKIFVHQEAQKTQAYQLNNNLLLSDQAQADSKPNLEIFADDVKASHGSTVGQLDQEQLFYLKTRGFNQIHAQNLLIYGFCKEVIDMIDVFSLHQEVTQRAQRYLQKD